jgi:hypothetical protein
MKALDRRQFLAGAAAAPLALALPGPAISAPVPAFAAGELSPARHWFRLLAEGDDWRVTMSGAFPDLDAALDRFTSTLPGPYRSLSWARNQSGPQMPRATLASVHHHR